MAQLKDLFVKTYSSASLEDIAQEAESYNYLEAFFNDQERFIPHVDFSNVENFAKFGSAEQYYDDGISRIYKTYPYDGSLYEKHQWLLSSSYFDIHIFENEYPRTNGYVIFSAHTGGIGASGWGAQNDTYGGYGAPETGSYEYIEIQGGPHTSKRVKNKDILDESGDWKDGYANKLDIGKHRESNLKLGGTLGNTVEFWMKKSEFVTSLTAREVIFDVALTHTGGMSEVAGQEYARLTIEMSGGAGKNDSPFYVTYMSGTGNHAGFLTASIGTDLSPSDVADDEWHHYAFTFKNISTHGEDTNNLEAKLYIDGRCNHTITGGAGNLYKYTSGTPSSAINYISGTLTGTIGSLCAHTIDSTRTEAGLGWGKLSASLDDFRFWKTKRSSKEIGLNYFRDVGGGANTDLANTDLGFYYKFNEGITQSSSIDQTILDYSGRISNGTFVGYKASSRSTGSAIVESSASATEFKDPILYPFHADVDAYAQDRKKVGIEYDYRNNASMYHSLPAWIIEEDEYKADLTAKKLTQIMSSYFDTLWSQIDSLNKIKNETYTSSSFKPYPFSKHLLYDKGMFTPELFADATVVEHTLEQNHNKVFENQIHNLKNLIYNNIHNSLVYIYKSKGTEKAFRNLIRCFGVDDEIVKLNSYAHGVTYDFKDNFRDSVARKTYINFYTSDSDTLAATVHQMTASNNLNSTSFMSGTIDSGSAMTFETEVIFPKLQAPNEKKYVNIGFLSSSIFGVHSPRPTSADLDTAWGSPDYANFQVYAARNTLSYDVLNGKGHTLSDAKFVLTSSNESLGLALESPLFRDVYDERKWNFAVRVLPEQHPQNYKLGGTHFGSAPGSTSDTSSYKVEFYGVNIDKDIISNSFFVTGTISDVRGASFLTGSKRLYVGAHRTNFTGTLLNNSDARISSTRVWADYLENSVINAHARDATNFGTKNAYWHAYPGQTELKDVHIPQMETLALHWDFSQVSSSNINGRFEVHDMSSGSIDLFDRYGTQGHLLKKQHPGSGYAFPGDTTIATRKFVQTSKQNTPENMHTSDMIKILKLYADDDLVFTRETRPISNFFSFEKSMYQTISEEIINFFATIVDFNNLIGEPVNRYRQDYKDLSKLRQLFFERVGNTPRLTKYIDYYKWIDSALGIMLEQLVPASAEFGQGIRNMVESHILERNKYWTKFPTLEMKRDDPEAHLFGINEMLYNWKYGHAPTSVSIAGETEQTGSCLWWKDRSEKDGRFSVGDAYFDEARQKIQEQYVSKNITGSTYAIRRFSRPYRYKVDINKTIHGGINFSRNKKLDYSNEVFKVFDNSDANNYLQISASNFGTGSVDTYSGHMAASCYDESDLNTKRKFTYKVEGANSDIQKGEFLAPFNILDQDKVEQKHDSGQGPSNARLVNIHHDTYGDDKETPLQGPFTEKFVGGRQHRHVWSFASLVTSSVYGSNGLPITQDATTRPEGWRLSQSATPDHQWYKISNPLDSDFGGYDNPRAVFYRDEKAKRPVNIKNIRQTTGSSDEGYYTNIGNYTHDYEVVQTHGRSSNNRWLVEREGHNISASECAQIESNVHFTLPDRNIKTGGPQEEGSSGGSKYVFVNRFSAPGGPEIMSRGYLDVEAEEYSLYNALPWRNISVRRSLNELSTNHTKQFGLQSDAQFSSSWNRAITQGIVNAGSYSGFSGSIIRVSAPNDSQAPATASFHQAHRNRRRVLKFLGDSPKHGHPGSPTFITSSRYDNLYVRHQIPQSDINYAWITSSVRANDPGLFGYETPDILRSGSNYTSNASSEIIFMTSSEWTSFRNLASGPPLNPFRWGTPRNPPHTSTARDYMHTDFAGLNHHIVETITSSDNMWGWPHGTPYVYEGVAYNPQTDAQYINRALLMPVLTFSSYIFGSEFAGPNRDYDSTWIAQSPTILNAILLNRGSIYGHPSWKQIRGYQHPLVRYWRKNNDYNFPDYDWVKIADFKKHHALQANISFFKGFKHFTEPPVSSKYKPLVHKMSTATKKTLVATHTYANNLAFFTNQNLIDELNKEFTFYNHQNARKEQYYENLKSIYIDNEIEVLSDLHYKKMRYKETIFPRESNTFLAETRGRTRFTEGHQTTGEEDQWPMATNVENSINRLTYNIVDGITYYKPLRTYWRDIKENRVRNIGKDVFRDEFGSRQRARTAWTFGPDAEAGDRASTSSVVQSVWPLDCDFPGSILVPGSGYGGYMNTSEISSMRYSMNLPTTSSATVFRTNGFLANSSMFHWFNRALSYHSGAFNQYTLGTEVGIMHPTASICYEYPRYDIVSQSTNAGSYRSHMWWATYRASAQRGFGPWYDSYGKYAENIRPMGKDYSIIPEFRISEHMDRYLSDPKGFQVDHNEFLTLEGAEIFSSSKNNVSDEFFIKFSHSERFKQGFMKYQKQINDDNKKIDSRPKQFTLSVEGIKKLLPYNGFYPVNRTVQLASMLSQSYGPHIIATTGSGVDPDTLSTYNLGTPGQKIPEEWRQEGLQAFLDNFYAPGIMYNTMKSGIAVDYPALTGAINTVKGPFFGDFSGSRDNRMVNIRNDFAFRYPFESILDPGSVLPISKSDGSGRIFGNLTSETMLAQQHMGRTHEYAWDGKSDPRYSLAAHNFFGEIPNFFLQEGIFTSFVSRPEKDCDLSFEYGHTYYMDVDIYKTRDLVMYEGPPKFGVSAAEGNPPGKGCPPPPPNVAANQTMSGSYTIHARGAPYGFPSQIQKTLNEGDPGGGASTGSIYHVEHYRSGNIGDPSYAPYTPPYFYGRATARMVFKPEEVDNTLQPGESQEFSLQQVIEHCKNNTFYFNDYDYSPKMNEIVTPNFHNHGIPSASQDNVAYRNAMAVSASVNLFTKTKIKKTMWDALNGFAATVEDPDDTVFDIWSINSKFETPILNYSASLDADEYGDDRVPHCNDADVHTGQSSTKVPSTSFGVWKDYGRLTNFNEGVFIELRDSFDTNKYGFGSNTGSLLQKIFKKAIGPASTVLTTQKKQMGKIASAKTISEAVVVMPYIEEAGKRKFISVIKKNPLMPGGITDESFIELYLRKIANDGPWSEINEDKEWTNKWFGQSVWDMCQKMNKYVIPPQFDWINNGGITPYAMYIFEFTHVLDKQDLSDIWQNLMPRIAREPELVPGRSYRHGGTLEETTPIITHPIHVVTGDQKGWGESGHGMPPRELLTQEELQNPKLRWMVFKVKQKARKSYFEATIDTTDDTKFTFDFNIGGKQEMLDVTYNYNWPYDFFSLVELAKVNAEIEYSKIELPGNITEEDVEDAAQKVEDLKKLYEKATGESGNETSIAQAIEFAARDAEAMGLGEPVKIPPGAHGGPDPRISMPNPQDRTTAVTAEIANAQQAARRIGQQAAGARAAQQTAQQTADAAAATQQVDQQMGQLVIGAPTEQVNQVMDQQQTVVDQAAVAKAGRTGELPGRGGGAGGRGKNEPGTGGNY